jgi:hypothetical protein
MQVDGFAFSIYPGDHDPPHVHVWYSGKMCRIVLDTLDLSRSDMNHSEENRAVRIVAKHHDELVEAWLGLNPRKGDRA